MLCNGQKLRVMYVGLNNDRNLLVTESSLDNFLKKIAESPWRQLCDIVRRCLTRGISYGKTPVVLVLPPLVSKIPGIFGNVNHFMRGRKVGGIRRSLRLRQPDRKF